MHGFIGARPALCKLQTEKVATVHSGQYTLALGGNLSEPDSLLIRQLETLQSIFKFYHGSLERIRMMCDSQKIFLTWMNVIWDCYLHFVRHYGDFLPGVFDPLPFLDLPKRVAATCFTKASYILQACQRRQHILGGCILYSNSILCTQLEPSITERLLLLKPNQRNHPARPVKSACDLPFGVRILNAFLTLTEYQNLYDALAESAYRQPSSRHSSGTFPDLFAASSSGDRDSSVRQIDESDDKRLSDPSPQVTSDHRGTDSSEGLGTTRREGTFTEILAKVVASATPVGTGEDAEQHTDGNSGITGGKESKSQSQCKTESSTPPGVELRYVEHTLSDERDVDGVMTIEGREGETEKENENSQSESGVFAGNGDEEDGTVKNEDSTTGQSEVTNSTAVFDSSSCESGLSSDVSLTMEAINVTGLKVMEYSSFQCQGQQCGEAKDKLTGSTCNDSNCTSTEPSGIDDVEICSLVLEDLIRKVVEELDKENLNLNSESSGGVGFAACCKSCANSQKSCYCSGGRAAPCESQENPCHDQGNNSFTNKDHCSAEYDLEKERVDFPRDIQDTDPRQSGRGNGEETRFNASPNPADFVKNDTNPKGFRNDLIVTHLVSNELFSNGNSHSAEHDLGKETVDVLADIYTTDRLKSDRGDVKEGSFVKPPRTAGLAENCQPIDTNPDKDNSSRTELVKTPIVCDSFSIRNLNVGCEKFLEKSFVCVDTCAD